MHLSYLSPGWYHSTAQDGAAMTVILVNEKKWTHSIVLRVCIELDMAVVSWHEQGVTCQIMVLMEV